MALVENDRTSQYQVASLNRVSKGWVGRDLGKTCVYRTTRYRSSVRAISYDSSTAPGYRLMTLGERSSQLACRTLYSVGDKMEMTLSV